MAQAQHSTNVIQAPLGQAPLGANRAAGHANLAQTSDPAGRPVRLPRTDSCPSVPLAVSLPQYRG